jgi:membrane associated rhomboid family serine protease
MGSSEGASLRDLLDEYSEVARNRDWHGTQLLIYLSVMIFGGEFLFVLINGWPSVRALNALLFLDVPEVAWPLAIFLHKGILHLLANIVLLSIYGPFFEPHFTRREFAFVFILAWIVTIGISSLVAQQFTEKPVAFYGISGFGYLMATYTAYSILRTHSQTRAVEKALCIIGVAAFLYPVLQASLWPIIGSEINGIHLSGALLGAILAYVTKGDR